MKAGYPILVLDTGHTCHWLLKGTGHKAHGAGLMVQGTNSTFRILTSEFKYIWHWYLNPVIWC